MQVPEAMPEPGKMNRLPVVAEVVGPLHLRLPLLLGSHNIGDLKIRIGFGGPLYYNYSKEPRKIV